MNSKIKFKKTIALLVACSFLLTSISQPWAQSCFWEQRKIARANLMGAQDLPYIPPIQSTTDLSSLEWAHGRAPLQDLIKKEPLLKPLKDSPILQALPLSYTTVRDAYFPSKDLAARNDPSLSDGTTDQIIIHIQDVHDNFQAQENIANSIKHLATNYQLPITNYPDLLVGLEGAQGPFLTSAYRAFPDKNILQRVSKSLLENNFLTGAEYGALTAGHRRGEGEKGRQGERERGITLSPHGLVSPSIQLWGVETGELYVKHVTALKESFKYEASMKKQVADMQQQVNLLKDKVYPDTLKQWDKLFAGYNARTIQLGDYVGFLVRSARSEGRRTKSNTQKFISALKEERAINFTRAENERKHLIRVLASNLKRSQLNDLMNHSVAFRVGQIGYKEFYDKLNELAACAGVSLIKYPEFSRYIRYVNLVEQIDRKTILEEIESLEKASVKSLLRKANPSAQKVYEMSRNLFLLDKVIKHQLTDAEWTEYKNSRESIHSLRDSLRNWPPSGTKLAGRADKIGSLRSRNSSSKPSQKTQQEEANFSQILDVFEQFYVAGIERNEALVDNLLKKLIEIDQPAADEIGSLRSRNWHPMGTKLEKDEGHLISRAKGEPISSATSSWRTNFATAGSQFQSKQPRVAVLISGGFHTRGICDILKNKRTAYIVLAPKFDKIDGHDYLDAFREDKTPLEKLFAGESLTIVRELGTVAQSMHKPAPSPRHTITQTLLQIAPSAVAAHEGWLIKDLEKFFIDFRQEIGDFDQSIPLVLKTAQTSVKGHKGIMFHMTFGKDPKMHRFFFTPDRVPGYSPFPIKGNTKLYYKYMRSFDYHKFFVKAKEAVGHTWHRLFSYKFGYTISKKDVERFFLQFGQLSKKLDEKKPVQYFCRPVERQDALGHKTPGFIFYVQFAGSDKLNKYFFTKETMGLNDNLYERFYMEGGNSYVSYQRLDTDLTWEMALAQKPLLYAVHAINESKPSPRDIKGHIKHSYKYIQSFGIKELIFSILDHLKKTWQRFFSFEFEHTISKKNVETFFLQFGQMSKKLNEEIPVKYFCQNVDMKDASGNTMSGVLFYTQFHNNDKVNQYFFTRDPAAMNNSHYEKFHMNRGKDSVFYLRVPANMTWEESLEKKHFSYPIHTINTEPVPWVDRARASIRAWGQKMLTPDTEFSSVLSQDTLESFFTRFPRISDQTTVRYFTRLAKIHDAPGLLVYAKIGDNPKAYVYGLTFTPDKYQAQTDPHLSKWHTGNQKFLYYENVPAEFTWAQALDKKPSGHRVRIINPHFFRKFAQSVFSFGRNVLFFQWKTLTAVYHYLSSYVISSITLPIQAFLSKRDPADCLYVDDGTARNAVQRIHHNEKQEAQKVGIHWVESDLKCFFATVQINNMPIKIAYGIDHWTGDQREEDGSLYAYEKMFCYCFVRSLNNTIQYIPLPITRNTVLSIKTRLFFQQRFIPFFKQAYKRFQSLLLWTGTEIQHVFRFSKKATVEAQTIVLAMGMLLIFVPLYLLYRLMPWEVRKAKIHESLRTLCDQVLTGDVLPSEIGPDMTSSDIQRALSARFPQDRNTVVNFYTWPIDWDNKMVTVVYGTNKVLRLAKQGEDSESGPQFSVHSFYFCAFKRHNNSIQVYDVPSPPLLELSLTKKTKRENVLAALFKKHKQFFIERTKKTFEPHHTPVSVSMNYSHAIQDMKAEQKQRLITQENPLKTKHIQLFFSHLHLESFSGLMAMGQIQFSQLRKTSAQQGVQNEKVLQPRIPASVLFDRKTIDYAYVFTQAGDKIEVTGRRLKLLLSLKESLIQHHTKMYYAKNYVSLMFYAMLFSVNARVLAWQMKKILNVPSPITNVIKHINWDSLHKAFRFPLSQKLAWAGMFMAVLTSALIYCSTLYHQHKPEFTVMPAPVVGIQTPDPLKYGFAYAPNIPEEEDSVPEEKRRVDTDSSESVDTDEAVSRGIEPNPYDTDTTAVAVIHPDPYPLPEPDTADVSASEATSITAVASAQSAEEPVPSLSQPFKLKKLKHKERYRKAHKRKRASRSRDVDYLLSRVDTKKIGRRDKGSPNVNEYIKPTLPKKKRKPFAFRSKAKAKPSSPHKQKKARRHAVRKVKTSALLATVGIFGTMAYGLLSGDPSLLSTEVLGSTTGVLSASIGGSFFALVMWLSLLFQPAHKKRAHMIQSVQTMAQRSVRQKTTLAIANEQLLDKVFGQARALLEERFNTVKQKLKNTKANQFTLDLNALLPVFMEDSNDPILIMLPDQKTTDIYAILEGLEASQRLTDLSDPQWHSYAKQLIYAIGYVSAQTQNNAVVTDLLAFAEFYIRGVNDRVFQAEDMWQAYLLGVKAACVVPCPAQTNQPIVIGYDIYKTDLTNPLFKQILANQLQYQASLTDQEKSQITIRVHSKELSTQDLQKFISPLEAQFNVSLSCAGKNTAFVQNVLNEENKFNYQAYHKELILEDSDNKNKALKIVTSHAHNWPNAPEGMLIPMTAQILQDISNQLKRLLLIDLSA